MTITKYMLMIVIKLNKRTRVERQDKSECYINLTNIVLNSVLNRAKVESKPRLDFYKTQKS